MMVFLLVSLSIASALWAWGVLLQRESEGSLYGPAIPCTSMGNEGLGTNKKVYGAFYHGRLVLALMIIWQACAQC